MIADYPEYHPPYWWEPEIDEDDDEFLEDEDNGSTGCLFSDECLIPGKHLTFECHTQEMLEVHE